MNLGVVVATLMATGWLGSQAAPQVDPSTTLAQAEARWQQRKPSAYEFSVEVRCFCLDLLQKPVPFRVTEGEVRSLQDLEPASQGVYEHYNTIEKLFAAIRRSLTFGQYKITVEYDPELGFPAKADLDPREWVKDDDLFFRVTGFQKVGTSIRSGLPNTYKAP